MSATNVTVCKFFLTTVKNIDDIRCFFANFSGTIYYTFNIGYVNIALTLTIIIISIFGKFKENYRWFVFNQAIWDLIAANEYNCSNLMKMYIFTDVLPTSSCYFYDFKGYWKNLENFYNSCMFANPLTALLLLSFSRVLVFYFENLYEKLTKNYRIFFSIIAFNIFVSLVHMEHFIFALQDIRNSYLKEKCALTNSITTTTTTPSEYCNPETDNLLIIYKKAIQILISAQTYKDFLCLLFSTIFGALLGYRIIKTFILLKNRKNFLHSFRISFAIILQIFVSIVFFSSSLISFIPIFLKNLGFKVLASDGVSLAALKKDPNYCQDCIRFQVPLWMESYLGLKSGHVIQASRQCRIFIDSIIVLSIITGYREAIVDCCKLIFFVLKHPKKAFSKVKSKIVKNQVTILK